MANELCVGCKPRHPETTRSTVALPRRSHSNGTPGPRSFTPGEKALIRKVHGYMPPEQLLAILNERLTIDLGSTAIRYSMDQLYAEIGDASSAIPAGGHDWASLRKLLANAKSAGVLGSITEQVVDDFATVFSLNPRQVLRLKDILLRTEEDNA